MNLSPEKKIAGILAPLFALRGENDLGIGDVAALREFIDWAAGIGFKLVQLLPINEIGSDNSPYNAISAIAIEPTTLHLAPNSPQELTRQDYDASLTEADVSGLRGGPVKYRQVKKLKQRLLEKAFENFSANASEDRRSEFRKFCQQESALLGDIPFGVSYCSADVFARPDEFVLDWFGGAPPEPYFEDDAFTRKWGQNWGIPLYRWERMRANNFLWWRQRVRGVRRIFHLF